MFQTGKLLKDVELIQALVLKVDFKFLMVVFYYT